MQEDGACTRPVVLEPLFRALARQFAEAARYKGIALRICRSRAVIRSNPILIDTILRNLIDNALAYSPAGGRVLVGCRRRGAMIRIEVRDNGKGIAAEDLDKVFKAFSRLDHSRPEGLGSASSSCGMPPPFSAISSRRVRRSAGVLVLPSSPKRRCDDAIGWGKGMSGPKDTKDTV